MAESTDDNKVLSFKEDDFDLLKLKKSVDTLTREKARIKRINRQVALGKVILFIVAFLVFFILLIVLFSLGFVRL